MADEKKYWSRRDFMKIAGAAGIGAVASPVEHLAGAATKSDSDIASQKFVAKRMPIAQLMQNAVDKLAG